MVLVVIVKSEDLKLLRDILIFLIIRFSFGARRIDCWT